MVVKPPFYNCPVNNPRRDLTACSGNTVEFLLNPNNLLLIAVAIGSAAMLAWPMIQRGRAGGTVTTTEAVQLMNQKHAVLIDIRPAAEFAAGHIPQARNVPAAELKDKSGSLPKNKPLILVCNQGRSALGVAAKLRGDGFADVFTLDGGHNGWATAGLPVTSGK